MKDHKFGKYIVWGVTAFLVILASTLVVMLIFKWNSVYAALRFLGDILSPITYGIILAYLLAPVYNGTFRLVTGLLEKVMKNGKRIRSISRFASTAASLVVLAGVVTGLFLTIIPTVWESVIGIVNSIPSYAGFVSRWIEETFASYPEVESTVMSLYGQAVNSLVGWIQSNGDWMSNLEAVFGRVFSGIIGLVNVGKNSLIGAIVMVYLLNIKDTLLAQAKKAAYGLFSVKFANSLIDKCRFVHRVFGGFIVGKIIDSCIIGVLTFVVLTILRMPYAMLISVIIGVTNVIPVFGPFIGAIPSALLLLLVNPRQCLIFLVVILLIQQFDGNILGPKILGDSTGLSSFWVLFSILFFGGLLGPAGMVIGVPTFAVIYKLITEKIEKRLNRKKLPTDTNEYRELDHIDEERGIVVR